MGDYSCFVYRYLHCHSAQGSSSRFHAQQGSSGRTCVTPVCSFQRSCCDAAAANAEAANILWGATLPGRSNKASRTLKDTKNTKRIRIYCTFIDYPFHPLSNSPDVCSWESRTSNHWRWKMITTAWTNCKETGKILTEGIFSTRNGGGGESSLPLYNTDRSSAGCLSSSLSSEWLCSTDAQPEGQKQKDDECQTFGGILAGSLQMFHIQIIYVSRVLSLYC